MALAKVRIAEAGVDSAEEIHEVIEKAADELDVTLTDEQRKAMTDVFDKISGLNLDVDKLKQQAEDVYDKLKQLGLDAEKASGILSRIVQFFEDVADSIVSFFKNLF